MSEFAEIKHISLDAWNTVLIPNPEFAEIRTTTLANVFNCSRVMAKAIYASVKKEMDTRAEQSGEACNVEWLYQYLVDRFPRVNEIDAEYLRVNFIEHAFSKPEYRPTILQETRAQITRLHAERGITFSISSNTNFISGKILGPMIRSQINELSFMLFSDCMRSEYFDGKLIIPAKPHRKFFERVHEYAKFLHGDSLKASEILHIGDSRICDFAGAVSAGLSAQLITDAYELPKALKEL